jgi:hypothetical protein
LQTSQALTARTGRTGRADDRLPIFASGADQTLLALLAGNSLLSSKADHSRSAVDAILPIAAGWPFGSVAHQRQPLDDHRSQFAKLGVNRRVASDSLLCDLGTQLGNRAAQLGNRAAGLRFDQRSLALPLVLLPPALTVPLLLFLRQDFGECLAPDIKQQIAVGLGLRILEVERLAVCLHDGLSWVRLARA